MTKTISPRASTSYSLPIKIRLAGCQLPLVTGGGGIAKHGLYVIVDRAARVASIMTVIYTVGCRNLVALLYSAE